MQSDEVPPLMSLSGDVALWVTQAYYTPITVLDLESKNDQNEYSTT